VSAEICRTGRPRPTRIAPCPRTRSGPESSVYRKRRGGTQAVVGPDAVRVSADVGLPPRLRLYRSVCISTVVALSVAAISLISPPLATEVYCFDCRLSVCLYVCLSVSRITQKVIGGFPWNLKNKPMITIKVRMDERRWFARRHDCTFVTSPPEGVRSIAMDVSVCLFCLSESITRKPHGRTSPTLCMLPMTVGSVLL